ncbi:zeta toxin family protein [Mucilaginibacter sp. AW1-7]|uniref:zeta toxin family protein n=1 Tax=Mucilaginibacter sp. AW1-7 TaxID=3349874 RepID=UPI003F739D1D
MNVPELIFVSGCNAAGKSTFIRTRLNELSGFEIIMTDVYKARTRDVFKRAVKQKKSIILETVFNDASFKDLVDECRDAGYSSSLVALFLDNPKQSKDRVAVRGMQQSGITISGSNVDINFNESFKNLAAYFFYFDRSYFVYTGIDGKNQQIMSFEKSKLLEYQANNLKYPQLFAQYSFGKQRLSEEAYELIKANNDYQNNTASPPNGLTKFDL